METLPQRAADVAAVVDAANRNYKLACSQIDEIRSRYAAGGVTQREIASRYGIHQVSVSRIVLRKSRRTTRELLLDRFWSRVNKNGPVVSYVGSPCWVWTGGTFRGGYGKLRCAGKTAKAHRLSYELHVGPVGTDVLVCHRCDNPACVRPDHLFLGTHADNAADREAKGRGLTGDKNPVRMRPEIRIRGERSVRAKLTDESVREIVKRFAAGERARALAVEFGVSKSAVWRVVSGRGWQVALEGRPEAVLARLRRRGTQTRGARNPNAKINDTIADMIRADHASGESMSATAARYGVSKQTVSNIVRGKSWAK